MKHSMDMQEKKEHFETEYNTLKESNDKLQIDFNILKKKEKDYDHAIAERKDQLHKIHHLTADRDRLFFQVKSLDNAINISDDRIKQLEKEVVIQKELADRMSVQRDNVKNKTDKLKGRIVELKRQLVEREKFISGLNSKILILDT